jgi:hypothetical protein
MRRSSLWVLLVGAFVEFDTIGGSDSHLTPPHVRSST